MKKKETLIEQIKNFDSSYFNEDQKLIAINILENAEEQEAQAYADFLFNKRRTGFSFDYSPEIAKGRIITLRDDKKRGINIDDSENNDENKLIIGDNYNALKSLLITHKYKIDIIYIDPPYNTESAKNDGNNDSYKEGSSSKFIYKDKFGRCGWLNMMKDRLTLAKDLLKDDGLIFISIDDSEQAYLKILMDQIFGEDNFISCMPRLLKRGGKSTDSIQKNIDYILFYGKKNAILNKKQVDPSSYKLEDEFNERGKFHLKQTLDYDSLQYSKKMDFKIEINGQDYFPGGESSFNERKKGKYQSIDWVWRWSESKVEAGKKLGFLVEKNGRIYTKTYYNCALKKVKNNYEIVFINRKQPYEQTEMAISNSFNNDNAKKELKSILNKSPFKYPKPTFMIKYLINLNLKNDITVLDFFAGSGTTGHAVMELNREDNGSRKFILVTNNENNIAYNITYERLRRIIKGEGSEKQKNYDWLKSNKPYEDSKLRVINIDDSIKISLNDENIDESIFYDCKKGLKLLDKKYNKKDLNLYFDLAALNPIKKEGE